MILDTCSESRTIIFPGPGAIAHFKLKSSPPAKAHPPETEVHSNTDLQNKIFYRQKNY